MNSIYKLQEKVTSNKNNKLDLHVHIMKMFVWVKKVL